MENPENQEIKIEEENSPEQPINQNIQQTSLNINIMNEDDSIIPRETVTTIYGDNYDLNKLKLFDTENETIEFLNKTINNLQNKYNEFNTDIHNHFIHLTTKISDAFKLNNNSEENMKKSKKEKKEALIQKYSNEYIEQLRKIISMHQQIIKNIQNTFSIFYNFLDVSKLLVKEKPINEFISKEFKNIVNNWLFMEIDLGNCDFTKLESFSNLDSNLKDLIIKIKKNNDFVLNITNPKEYMRMSKKNFKNLHSSKVNELNDLFKRDKQIMIDNHNNLAKLKIKNSFYVDSYFMSNLEYNKLKYLKLDNITFKSTVNNSKNFLEVIPSIEKLSIRSALNFEISLLKGLSDSLIKLSLTKNGFIDYEFNNIITNYLLKSEPIRKNLQYLSFRDNYLSNVNLSQLVYHQKHSFLSLK